MHFLSLPNSFAHPYFNLKSDIELEIPRRRVVQPPLGTTYVKSALSKNALKKCRILGSSFHSMYFSSNATQCTPIRIPSQ